MKMRALLISTCGIFILVACSLGALPLSLTSTPSLTPAPSETPIPSPTPTSPPTPTPIPEVRLVTGDRALFDGDLIRARDEYQIAAAGATDPEVRAAALWGLGRVEYDESNSIQAIDYLRQLVGNYPTSKVTARAYFLLGEIYMSLERYSESADAYNAYFTLRPGVIDDVVLDRRGDALAAAGKYPEAIAAYQAAQTAPHIGDNTALQIKIAQAYASAGNTPVALKMFESIAANSSNDYVKAQMDLLAGQVYLSLGQTAQAYERFLHAVNNYPLAYDSYSALVALVDAGVPVDDFNRGLVDFHAGKYGPALEAFDRYIAANPQNDGTVHYYRALTLEGLGNYEEAVNELSLFILTYPANLHWSAAWDEKASIQWADLDQPEAAAQTLLDFATASPSNQYVPQSLLAAGRYYESAGKLGQAAGVWEGLANTYPNSDLVPQALFWAGISRYRNGTFEAALATFQRDLILSTSPEDQARAYFWIGKTQQKKGDASAAQAAWQQAASLDGTGYYGERARDMLFNRPIFEPPPTYNLTFELAAERPEAEAWIRVKFNLPPDTDLSSPGALLADPRLMRGTELWNLGLYDEARLEFEDLRQSVSNDPANSYRLANYLLDLGLYRPAIFAARQVLTLAGMQTQEQTLAAPRYFNHVRYGTYYQDILLPIAKQDGFDPLLLFAVVRQESLFEGFIRSTAGARGLMQIIPTTGDEIARNMGWPPNYTADDLYRPLVSLTLGSHYLMTNRTYLGGDLVAALAAYNAGPLRAQIWQQLAGSDPDLFVEVVRSEQTRDYLRGIYEIYFMYRTLYGVIP